MLQSKIRTIIADSEPRARRSLRLLLDSEPGIRIIAECDNCDQILKAVKEDKPDLVFLDVQMPDSDGIQMAMSLSAEERPMVVFTTDHDRYAIRAFEAHALDYLLKPLNQERLRTSIQRARSEILHRQERKLANRILEMASAGEAKYRMERRFVVRSSGMMIFLDFDEIDWIEAAANYVKLNAGKESYQLRGTISRVAERLDPNQFVRIHRSTLVNIEKIKALQRCNGGEYMVILKNGKELACSRSYRNGLDKLVENAM